MAETITQHVQALEHEAGEEAPEQSPAEVDAYEDTELHRLRLDYSRASSVPGRTILPAPTTIIGRIRYCAAKFWRHQVSIIVDHDTCRDHLALERTFLGYLRTSLALSAMGIIIAQLLRLFHAPTPNPAFGFYILAKPLSIIPQVLAIFTLLVGAFRTWRSQNAIVRGKALSGGWEIVILMLLVFLMLLTFFILVVVIDVEKEDLRSRSR